MNALDELRRSWTKLYAHTLPSLAKARDPAQPKWPVSLDHCFARIILDNVIGNGELQWDSVLKKPAVQNMDEGQLRDAIALAEEIRDGKTDLCALDEISLNCRGKNKRKYWTDPSDEGDEQSSPPRKRRNSQREADDRPPSETLVCGKKQSTISFNAKSPKKLAEAENGGFPPPSEHRLAKSQDDAEIIDEALKRIQAHPHLTPYRRRLYTVLLSVPRGRYTTYAAMSEYLDSSARAVGSGMRNNPFAPEVPCHRVLAANGSIGGFCGDWGKDGKYAKKKIDLLRGEGVRFDGHGKVVGEPFRKFHEFQSGR